MVWWGDLNIIKIAKNQDYETGSRSVKIVGKRVEWKWWKWNVIEIHAQSKVGKKTCASQPDRVKESLSKGGDGEGISAPTPIFLDTNPSLYLSLALSLSRIIALALSSSLLLSLTLSLLLSLPQTQPNPKYTRSHALAKTNGEWGKFPPREWERGTLPRPRPNCQP